MERVSERVRVASVRMALASLALSMLLSSMGISIVNLALPTLARAFDASFQTVQWVVLAYLLAITTMVVGVGRFGDLLGLRRMLLTGLALFTAASLLCGVVPTLWLLIGARAIQGVGAAILMTVAMALVRETVPKERTGSVMGLLGTMSAIGTAAGPSLGGVLVSVFGWRSIFLIAVPMGILAYFLAHRHLPADAHGTKTKAGPIGFDGFGMLLLCLTLAAYALSMTLGGGRFGGSNLILLCLAGLGTLLFVLVESKVASPLIRPAAFRHVALDVGLIMNAFVATVMMATLVVGPFYLDLALGLNEAFIGFVMSIGPIISTFSGIPAGRLVDRYGASHIVVVGLVAMATGSFALSILPEMLGIAGYIAAIIVLTPGYQLFQAANNTAVLSDTGPDQRGVVAGLLGLSRNLGLITGASAMGAIFSHASGRSDIASAGRVAVAAGMQMTFAVAGGLMIAALAIGVVGRALALHVNRQTGRPE